MRLRKLIEYLESVERRKGDIELYSEYNDGRSTDAIRISPQVVFKEIWKGHGAGKKHFLEL